MNAEDFGQITHISRVEQWECDYNAHWNTRYYNRAFHQAAEALLSDGENLAPARPFLARRHIRFHREMLSGTAIMLRSGRLADGEFSGALVHRMSGNGSLSATAIDILHEGALVPDCTAIRSADCPEVLPRGLSAEIAAQATTGWDQISRFPAATLRPGDLDHTGMPTCDTISRLTATASHEQMNRVGLTREFSEETRISRMNAEARMTLAQPVRAGSILYVQSRLLTAGAKTFISAHRISRSDGTLVGLVELCLLAVDLRSRKVIEVPDFIRAAVSG